MRAAVLGAIAGVVFVAVGAGYYASLGASRSWVLPATSAPPRSRAQSDVGAAQPPRAESGAALRPRESLDELDASYETAAASPPDSTRLYVVREGDSLASIAEQLYGDATRAEQIYEANRDRIRDPAHLHAGQALSIP